MKIFISYPPIKSEKGTAQIGQNRQFQWFVKHSVIYPMIPAYAASLLKERGYGVFWDDAIAKQESWEKWIGRIEEEKPDLIAIETKTPVVKIHWRIIDKIKEVSEKTKVVLMGDHVTAFPEESMKNSKADFVITGGDYDFLLLSICDNLSKNKKLDEGKKPLGLEPGVWFRQKGKIKNTGKFNLCHDLNSLPFIDRELTRYDLYTENGNYKYLPGSYTMVGRDCWWGKCKFCFTGDTKVFTNQGMKAIKEIVENKIRCNVLTKEGKFEKINNYFRRDYSGRFTELKLQYLSNPITCTEDHSILSAGDKICFKEAKEIIPGDYVAIPIIQANKTIKEINVKEILSNLRVDTYKKYDKGVIDRIFFCLNKGMSERGIAREFKIDRETVRRYISLHRQGNLADFPAILEKGGEICCVSSKKSVKAKIKIKNDFFRLVGFYLAEGCVSKLNNRRNSYVLSFTFSEKEKRYIDDVKALFKKYFDFELKEIYNKANHTIQLTCLSNIHARLFQSLFNSGSMNKDFPFEWLFDKKENQKELIKGLFYGDGHLRIRNESGCEYIYSTASEQLSWKVFNLLLRLEVIPRQTIRKVSGLKQKHIQHIISISEIGIKKIFGNEFNLPNRKYTIQHGFFEKGYLFVKVVNKKSFEKAGAVYNLTVENSHTYTANAIAVANCSWPTLFPSYRTRSPELLFKEIEMLVEKYGIREIMDDTGTFPVGEWLRKFCSLMIKSGLNRKVRISCNMRFGTLKQEDYNMMRKAGFRFLLYGLESGNQETLDKINKGIKIKDIVEGSKMAKKAGLNPHLTVMIGYPWEDYEDAKKTIDLVRYLFERGYADTLQATIVMPYPNTPLYKEAKKNNWLSVKDGDWEKFDMRQKILKSPLTEEQIKELTSELYKLAFNPKFVFNQVVRVRNIDDIKYLWRGFKAVVGKHLKDFSN